MFVVPTFLREKKQILRCARDDGRLLLPHQLDLDRHLDVVADDPAAGFERLIPVQPEVLAVDLALGLETHALPAPRIARAALEFGVERDLAGRTANRQVPDELELAVDVAVDALALERHRRVLLDVEEVG